MGKFTLIQWCDSTVNPVAGCSGCELWNEERKSCYAGQLHDRYKSNPGFSPDFLKPKLFPGRMAEAAKLSDLSGTVRADKPWLDELPRLIFVSDMGDALSEKNAIDFANKPVKGGAVPFGFLKAEIIDAAMSQSGRRHHWLWLTKRPTRLNQFSKWLKRKHGLDWPANVWVGTSITGPKAMGRVEHLRNVGGPGTIRFLSVEPLWEEVCLQGKLDGISWVILGGESAQAAKAKEFKLEWAAKIRDECDAAGVAFFLKQMGTRPTYRGERLLLSDRHGGDWDQWPEEFRVRQMPKITVPSAEIRIDLGGELVRNSAIRRRALPVLV